MAMCVVLSSELRSTHPQGHVCTVVSEGYVCVLGLQSCVLCSRLGLQHYPTNTPPRLCVYVCAALYPRLCVYVCAALYPRLCVLCVRPYHCVSAALPHQHTPKAVRGPIHVGT